MNKKIVILIIVLVGFLVGGIVIVSLFMKHETNWEQTLKKEDKSPFGMFLFYENMQQLTGAKTVKEIKNLDELKDLNPKTDAILFIDHINSSSDQVIDAINELNNKPFKTFYSSVEYYTQEPIDKDDKVLAIIDSDTLNVNKNRYILNINYLDESVKQKQLGSIDIYGKKYTNYYLLTNEKMLEYTHTQPLFFTNFFLLEKDGFKYTKSVFKDFNGKNIYWINPNRNYYESTNDDSPLSYILSQKELKTAWYIILAALGLYLIFKSRREQKIIPIVEPEKNLTIEFTNAIASMYYESGNPSDIVRKQIDYFFYSIRKQFNVITKNTEDEHFIYILAQKAQISEEETIELLSELKALYNNPKCILKDVNRTHELIENYKKKANLL